jgi:hypothetical protein
MSARGSGSWAQFRAAVERLVPDSGSSDEGSDKDDVDPSTLSLHQTLRLNLERLGFAEFFGAAGDEEWRVAPPVLVVGRFGGRQAGFLTGARSDAVMQRIEVAANPHRARVEPQENCPDSVFLETDDRSLLAHIAASAGLVSQPDAPAAILSAIPGLSSNTLIIPADAPIGREWAFERFRERDLRWETTGRAELEAASYGLFRLRFRYRTEFVLRWAGRTFRTTPQEAKFLLLRRVRKHVLTYDPQSTTLTVPAICRPPLLIDRALLLCSGRLPKFEIREAAASLLYQDISSAIASTVASLLRQRLM